MGSVWIILTAFYYWCVVSSWPDRWPLFTNICLTPCIVPWHMSDMWLPIAESSHTPKRTLMDAAWGQLPRKGVLHRTWEGGHVLLMIIKYISDITYVQGCVDVSKRDRPHEDKPPMSQQDLLIVATGLEIICHSAALEIDSLDCGRKSGKHCYLNCPLLSLAVGGWEDQTAWELRLHVCAL